ncbi:11332_t:CDS:2, partial [Acaulospora colombiana]
LRKRFQQNMQDCTFTIMAYMPTLASRILEELDVERISLELQNRSKKQAVLNSQPGESSAEAAPPPRLDWVSSESDVPTTTSEEASAPSNHTHLSASLGSAVELEASSPISSFSNLSERDASNSQPGAPSFASPSIGQAASEDQNTSSYLSNMESSDPLSSSLPLSSNPLADSEISWVQFQNRPTENHGGNSTDLNSSAEPKTGGALEDNLPIIPDLELPSLDLSSVSIVDTQSAAETQASDRVQPNHGGSAMSHIGDTMDTRDEKQERQREKEQQSEFGTDLFDSLGLVGSFVHSVAPALSSALGSSYSVLQEEETHEPEDLLDDDIERKYLTLSWWLLHIGWRDVASRVRTAAEEILQGVSLKSRLSMNDLRDLLAQMRKQIEFVSDSSIRS